MSDLGAFAELGRRANGLAVVSTLRADATIHSTLVNAGVMTSPFDDHQVLAFVTYGAVKLANLRVRPQLTVTVQAGWHWSTIEGQAQLVGPDDPHEGVDAEDLRLLLRTVFTAAGGSHNNWQEYDRVMVQERRTAVFVTPSRVYGN
jgi:PPOX class probable F420-dependent enzyme